MRFLLPVLLLLLAAAIAAIPSDPATNTAALTNLTTFSSPSVWPALRTTHNPLTVTPSDARTLLLTASSHSPSNPLVCIQKNNPNLIQHIHIVANDLIAKTKRAQLCKQNIPGPAGMWRCDEKAWWNSVSLRVCGPRGKNVRCHTLAWAAKHIANNCKDRRNRAAGMYWFEEAGVWAHVE